MPASFLFLYHTTGILFNTVAHRWTEVCLVGWIGKDWQVDGPEGMSEACPINQYRTMGCEP